jgi:hypothetical protein
MTDEFDRRKLLRNRVAWFVLLYAGGVLAVAVVALAFRVLILAATH